MQEPLGEPDAAEVEAVVEPQALRPADDELGRAAADVEHERLLGQLAPESHASKGQLRLVVAGEQTRLEAVAPLDLTEKSLTVLGVANRAGGDRERPLGAQRLSFAPEVGEHVADAGHRRGEEALALVDALAEARDLQPPDDLRDRPVLDVGDEQAR